MDQHISEELPSTRMTRGGQWALIVAGTAVGVFGAWSLIRLGVANLAWTLVWLGGGVLAHDIVLAGIVIGLGLVGFRALPRWARGPAAGGLVVLGSVTLMAIPVLGRFGAKPDNPTLLDRSYLAGWLVVAGIVVAGVLAAGVVNLRRDARQTDGDDG